MTVDTHCPEWCDGEHLFEHAAGNDECLHQHSRVLVEGHETETHGPLYCVELETLANGLTRLWIEINGTTMTADQAEVCGRAVIEGAKVLRGAAHPDPTVNLTGFQDGARYCQPGPFVFPATPAERELSR